MIYEISNASIFFFALHPEGDLWVLQEDGMKGLLYLTLRRQQTAMKIKQHARDLYTRVLSGTNMEWPADWDDDDSSDSEIEV